jgi:hypothetical protein
VEVVGNGLDDNCIGGDLASAEVPGDGMVATREGNRPDRMPDVIFISLDAVRADHLTAATMPTVSALTSRGLHAPIAYTTVPYTSGAVWSVFTSTYHTNYADNDRFYGFEPYLTSLLVQAGYRAVAVHCLFDISADMVNGFDLVDNSLGPICRDFHAATTDDMTELALRYLTERPDDRPLFLWAHFTDPHMPYLGGYETEVRRVDGAVRQLVDAAREDSVIVVFSDHGESFGAHGQRGHVWRLDEEVLRVVLVMVGQGVPQREIPWPVSLIDIAPTVTELLALPTPQGWQGRSLLHDPGARPVAFESRYRQRNDLRGIRLGDFKITYDRGQGGFELFDVVRDPQDRRELGQDHPELLRRMRVQLGRVFDGLLNDRLLRRKARLFMSRPVIVPSHIGPLLPGYARFYGNQQRHERE